MRELVMKYTAEKVCHEEMVKMPLDGSFRICMDYRKLSEIAIRNHCHQMRIHEEEIPKTDFRMRYGHFEFTMILGCVMDTLSLHEVKRGARVTFEDEFGAGEETELSCKAQQGRSGVKRKLFESFRNKIDEAVARHGVHVSSIPDRVGMYIEVLKRDVEVVRNTSRYEACVRNLVVVWILTFCEAEIEESKMIGLELEQEAAKVVVIKERLKEAKDHQ
nr:putative reverse transcriptase domain, ribonuclease H-like domain, aspartic peptidase domain protein [Tanacetum cinerariifolium]